MPHTGRRGRFARSVRRAAQRMLDTGSTAGVVANGKKDYSPAMKLHYENEETRETHLIPRRSTTAKQLLGIKRPQFETEPMRTRQLDHATGKMIETTDERLVWKSDETLLDHRKLDQFGEGRGTRFTRVTSRSKQPRIEIEIKPADDTTINLRGTDELHDPLDDV